MKDDKRKVVIVGALALVVVGIGAFQFMGGSAPAHSAGDAAKKAATAPTVAVTAVLKNPQFAGALTERDPFKSPIESTPPPAVTPPPVKSQTFRPRPPSMRGNFGDQLPAAGLGGGTEPLKVTPSATDFGYRLSGLIVGSHPAAVFTDPSGAQRLVSVGSSLDGDAQLVNVHKGQATIKFRGKRLQLSLGGSAHAE